MTDRRTPQYFKSVVAPIAVGVALAVGGIFFRGSWHDDNKWFCSELVGDLSGMFRRDRNMRVTPEHIWLISKDI